MTPGIKTSEGRIALLKVLVTSAIAICTAFGIAVPSWLKADAPWVSIAAMVVGGVITVAYSRQRTSLKQTIALTKPAPPPVPATPAPAPVPAAPGSAGYTLIEVCFAVLLLIIALVILFHYVH